jgi:hypothetical protein
MEETTRPLTADERRILERLRSSKPQGGAGFGAFLAFLVTTGLLLIVSPASWQVGVRSLIPVAAGLLAAGFVFRRLQRSRWRTEWLAKLERDLAAGVALVTTARVTDAVRVEEAEDEGSSYYLELDDKRVLFLSGQYLYEPEEERRFPNTLVTVVRAPAAGIVFDVRCDGSDTSRPVPDNTEKETTSSASARRSSERSRAITSTCRSPGAARFCSRGITRPGWSRC